MTREEQEHYEKLAEYYNAKQKPKTDTWSIKEVAKALERHGFGRLEQEPKTECDNCDYKEWLKGEIEPKTDILDKIRAEIADLDDADYDYEGYYKAVTDALQIIDKYKEEK